MAALRVVLLLLALIAPTTAPGQDLSQALGQEREQGTDAAGPNGTIATDSDAAQDAGIARRIRGILAALGDYEDVSVSVTEGIVQLDGTATSATDVETLDALVSRIEGVVAIRNRVTETAELGRRLDPAIERFQGRIDQIVVAAPLLLIAGAAFAAIAAIGHFLSGRVRLWNRLAPNPFIAELYGQAVFAVFLVAGVLTALDVLNASALLGTILGAAGILGLAVGFAVRDTVENYIASIMLSIRQPFRPNDVIEINGDEGKVIRLTSRATILLSFDGNHIRIPNATVFKSRIVNYTRNAERRFSVSLWVSTDSDLARAVSTAAGTVAGLPYVLADPAPDVWIEGVSDRGVEIVTAAWIDQRSTSLLRARGEALRLVKLALDEAGIALYDTSLTVRLDRDGAPEPARAHESRRVAEVAAAPENALDRIVEAERDRADTVDFLDRSARQE